MAEETKVAPETEEAKKSAKKAAKKESAKKAEEGKKTFAAPNAHDYEVVLEPVITEKSMAFLQNAGKVTVKVSKSANKSEIKDSFQRLYQVAVEDIKVINGKSKEKSRGSRYKGVVSGFKKAIVTLKEGNAVDLFKE